MRIEEKDILTDKDKSALGELIHLAELAVADGENNASSQDTFEASPLHEIKLLLQEEQDSFNKLPHTPHTS